MNTQHIVAIFLRHFYVLKTDISRILAIFFWPLLNILIFGYMGMWMAKQQPGFEHFEWLLIFSIVLWEVCTKSCAEMSTGLLEDIWSYNLITIFASPLRLYEWLCGIISFSLFVVIAVNLYCIGLIKLIYDVPLLLILKAFLLFGPPLFLSGLALSTIGLSLLISFGKRIAEVTWIIGWGFSPLAGVFYPVEVLPHTVQTISKFVPMMYVFKALRSFLETGHIQTLLLFKAYGLALLYVTIGLSIFFNVFKKSKQTGLTRLYD